LEISIAPIENTTSKFDLSLLMENRPDGLRGTLEYSTDIFEQQTMRQMWLHYEQILKAMGHDARQPATCIPMLTSEEREQVLTGWNGTHVRWQEELETVVAIIERQVRQTPSALALEFEGRQLSYGELNRSANSLANYLLKKGIGPEKPVALCLERSVQMVIAILGVLKAGAAYVPIDESYPVDRVQYMLRDAGAQIVLTQQKIKERLQDLGGNAARWICLDSEWAEISGASGENPEVRIEGENLAYIIYTSGSTGLPKGAMNTHAGLRNRLLWMQQAFALTADDKVLQKTPFSFDVSVWEFLWPLMYGACLVVAPPGGHRDSGYLAETIQAGKITTLHFVPSMLQVFAGHPGIENCVSLKRVIASGEALPAELVEKWRERSRAELHNLYGPTEASIDVSWWPCAQGNKEYGVPIGRPIANTRLYVVDDDGELVPAGVAGELLIGGIGLARGYWNRPELTAERFIPDHLSGESGARLYRTGDRARYHRDGVLEYIGRNDAQVKIRGYRIELGEVEAALRQLSSISEAAVMVRDDTGRGKRLVAYVAMVDGKSNQDADHKKIWRESLQEGLKKTLPEYMVPSAWVFLEHLPLSPNGKLDRAALLKQEPPDDSSRTAPIH